MYIIQSRVLKSGLILYIMTTAERHQHMTDRSASKKFTNSYLRSTVSAIQQLTESWMKGKWESLKAQLMPFERPLIITIY